MARRKRKGLTDEQMLVRFPVLRNLIGPNASADAWEDQLIARPDAVTAMLGDLIKHTYAVQGRVGQRPMPLEADVDLGDLVYGEVSEEPLVEILPDLIARVGSQRAFADKVMMSRTQLQRVLSGEVLPDKAQFDRIAKAVRKSPMYFMEYRKVVALQLLSDAIDERPVMAMRIIEGASAR